MTTKPYITCPLCVMRYGLKGSELAQKDLSDPNDFADHMEDYHGHIVRRCNETMDQAIERCKKKGINRDKTICQCRDCKEFRGEL